MSTMKVCFSPKIPYMVHSLLNNRSGNLWIGSYKSAFIMSKILYTIDSTWLHLMSCGATGIAGLKGYQNHRFNMYHRD
jgi:hypothetical protein